MTNTAEAVDRPVAVGLRPLRWTAIVCSLLFGALAVVVACHPGPLPGVETAPHTWSLDHRPGAAAAAARLLTATGTGVVPWLAVLAACVVAGRRLRTSCVLLGVFAAGRAARYGVMEAVARPRPGSGGWGADASGFSFPSGHTTTSALAAGLLCWAVASRCRPRTVRCAGALLGTWAVAVGLTRVYLGVHWAGDVLGGWLFTAAWLSAAGWLFLGKSRAGLPPAGPTMNR